MITELFPEELLQSYLSKWMNIALLGGSTVNEEALRKGVDFIYTLAELAIPKDVIVCDSPMEAQRTAQRLLEKNEFVPFSYLCGIDSGWLSFYDVFLSETDIFDSEPELSAKFRSLVEFISAGPFVAIYLDEAAIISRRPRIVRRDEQNRLHHDTMPALEFEDGYKMYYLDGRIFEEEMFKKISTKTITLKEINAISNADDRVVGYRYGLPPETMLKDMGAKLIHTGVKGTRLYRVENFQETGTTQFCMLMDCPTGREFLEWVDPSIGEQGDADLAQASAFIANGEPLTKEEYLNLVAEG